MLQKHFIQTTSGIKEQYIQYIFIYVGCTSKHTNTSCCQYVINTDALMRYSLSRAHDSSNQTDNLWRWKLPHMVPAVCFMVLYKRSRATTQMSTNTPVGCGAGCIFQPPELPFPDRLCPFALSHCQLPPEPESTHCRTWKNSRRMIQVKYCRN